MFFCRALQFGTHFGSKRIKNGLSDGHKGKFSNLEPFKSNFYTEHEIVTKRPARDVKFYREINEISVRGHAPNPIQNFNEVLFPDYILSEIRRQGYATPTPIQAQCWPIAMSGHNLVGIAKTGSGKTLSYMLPAIIHIKNQPPLQRGDGPIVLVLTPTRESAQQIQEVADEFGSASYVRNICVFSGAAKMAQWRALERGCEIVISTPGRLLECLEEEDINLKRCTYLVLDEADRMLEMGFEPQIKKILSQIRPDRQILMFSATWPKDIRRLAEELLGEHVQVKVGSTELCGCSNIHQIVEVCEESDKEKKLKNILEDLYRNNKNPGKILIFAKSKRRVDHLARLISSFQFHCRVLHADKAPKERDSVLREFCSGKTNIIVATDVVARALDVDGIKYIINFDYPPSAEDYIHRIGWIGHTNDDAISYTFFTHRNAKQAKDFIDVLRESNQEINPTLRQFARASSDGGKNCRQGSGPVLKQSSSGDSSSAPNPGCPTGRRGGCNDHNHTRSALEHTKDSKRRATIRRKE